VRVEQYACCVNKPTANVNMT